MSSGSLRKPARLQPRRVFSWRAPHHFPGLPINGQHNPQAHTAAPIPRLATSILLRNTTTSLVIIAPARRAVAWILWLATSMRQRPMLSPAVSTAMAVQTPALPTSIRMPPTTMVHASMRDRVKAVRIQLLWSAVLPIPAVQLEFPTTMRPPAS